MPHLTPLPARSTPPNHTTGNGLPQPSPQRRQPVWAGPCGDGPQGGITQSLIGRWLSCRERFRVLTIEGLRAPEAFSAPIEFGNIWHSAEEAHARRTSDPFGEQHGDSNWQRAILAYAGELANKYPFDRDKVDHWTAIAMSLFPQYVRWSEQHADMTARTPLLSEHEFDVPFKLPSGRVVRLRGKWDSVDIVSEGANAGVWFQENKSKSSIDGVRIARQLTFDNQTMIYIIALRRKYDEMGWAVHGPIRGVRYNVVRRSAHKSTESMLKKLHEDVASGRGGEWFARWNVEITEGDVRKFSNECLTPVLENICDDYEWWAFCHENELSPFDSDRTHMTRECEFPHHVPRHFRMPYGVWSPVADGGFGDVDTYLNTGSDSGLVRVTDLFPELRGGK